METEWLILLPGQTSSMYGLNCICRILQFKNFHVYVWMQNRKKRVFSLPTVGMQLAQLSSGFKGYSAIGEIGSLTNFQPNCRQKPLI